MVKCKEGHVTERQKQDYLQQLHCLQISWGALEDGPFLCAVSLLLSDMNHCAHSAVRALLGRLGM